MKDYDVKDKIFMLKREEEKWLMQSESDELV